MKASLVWVRDQVRNRGYITTRNTPPPVPHPKGPLIRIINLGSGSRGNCTLVCHGDSILLLDCGFSARQTTRRMAALGLNPQSVCGILITHEHVDHLRGATVFSRNTGAPILASAGTISAGGLTSLKNQPLQYGACIGHHDFRITPLRVSHDALEPCAFLVEVAGVRSLFITDIGTTADFDIAPLGDLDFLYVEANHDENLLRDGPYPAFLKARIAGDGGHLNNRQSGRLIQSLAQQSPHLRGIMLAHLSSKNNTQPIALNTVREYAGGVPDTRWSVAQQDEATELS